MKSEPLDHGSIQRFSVSDVDECAILGEDACGMNGKCVNLSPGWDCDCPTGFKNATVGSSHKCIGWYHLNLLEPFLPSYLSKPLFFCCFFLFFFLSGPRSR